MGAVARVLAETGLNPAALCLEVTESVLVVASQTTSLAIVSLRELGVQVSIDDFGTGYASLSYLVQFHPDSLKIDKTFVQRVGEDSMNFAIVAAIVGLAHSLGLAVVVAAVLAEPPARATFLTAHELPSFGSPAHGRAPSGCSTSAPAQAFRTDSGAAAAASVFSCHSPSPMRRVTIDYGG